MIANESGSAGSYKRGSLVQYHDLTLFLLLIPIINALNYYLTYSNIGFNWHTLVTFLVDTAQGYAAWWVIRMVIMALDRRLPFDPAPVKRIILQIVLTSATGLAVIIVSTEFLNWIVKGEAMPPSFYRFDIFIFLIWFFVINGIYIGLFYYQQLRASEVLRQSEKTLRQTGFLVKQGKQNLTIPFSEAAGFYVEDDYAVLVTNQGKKHLLDLSLDRVEKMIPGELFFRLNRQAILHRSHIRGYEKGDNGKITVVSDGISFIPPSISVSRTKAPAFKSWFEGQ